MCKNEVEWGKIDRNLSRKIFDRAMNKSIDMDTRGTKQDRS